MPTDSIDDLGNRALIHRLRMEAELRAIQAQAYLSRRADLADLERQVDELQHQVDVLTRDRDRLATERAAGRLIDEDEYARLKSAEYHLRRLLRRVDRSPFGLVARRRPGYRAMLAEFSENNA